MAVLEPLRRAVTEGLTSPDLGARLVRPIAISVDHGHTEAPDATGRHALSPESRLRIATAFALVCGVLFLPVEGSPVRPEVLASLLLLYTFHVVLTGFVLIASFTSVGRRHADSLAVLLLCGHAANLHVYVYLWPRHPGLAAGIIACLLMGNMVLFSWSAGRVLALGVILCVLFVAVGVVAVPHDEQRPDFAVGAIVVVVGSATAVGCARLLALLRASLALRQRELTDLSARLMAVQEAERRRLARELHDEFGQALTAVNAYLWLIERQPPGDTQLLRTRTGEARRVIATTLGAMRELSQLLRPSVLDTLGLVASLETLLRHFRDRHGIATNLTTDGLPDRLPADIETALYRITQEALTNVARHARASRVRVVLAATDEDVRLEIEDDGVGLPPRSAGEGETGIGLVGIRERVRSLRGNLTIVSRGGVRLTARVPLRAAAA
jgi:signal transduction histidine kinase